MPTGGAPARVPGGPGPGRAYPRIPSGWTAAAHRSVGPFTTHITFRSADGGLIEWASRGHRKHASRLSCAEGPGVWWAPHRASWWIGVLFAIGSICFLISGYLAYVEVSEGRVWPRAGTLEWDITAVNLLPEGAAEARSGGGGGAQEAPSVG